MSFPIKLNAPTYTCILPSTNKKIEFRPYLVKEEKILLIANESNNPEQIISAIKETISDCTFDKLSISTLPIFDIEFLYLMIRARSKGEEITLNVTCNNTLPEKNNKTTSDSTLVEQKKCTAVNKVVFNIINDTTVKRDPEHKNKIKITDDTHVLLKYPEYSAFNELTTDAKSDNKYDKLIKLIAENIEAVFNDAGVECYAKDYTLSDMISFVENLTEKQFIMINQFFDTMPKITGNISFTCKTCGFKHKNIEITGIQSFLD